MVILANHSLLAALTCTVMGGEYAVTCGTGGAGLSCVSFVMLPKEPTAHSSYVVRYVLIAASTAQLSTMQAEPLSTLCTPVHTQSSICKRLFSSFGSASTGMSGQLR